jgi:hypothetical protein
MSLSAVFCKIVPGILRERWLDQGLGTFEKGLDLAAEAAQAAPERGSGSFFGSGSV